MRALLRGLPGKPSHPPLTDASIGTSTVAVVGELVRGTSADEDDDSDAR